MRGKREKLSYIASCKLLIPQNQHRQAELQIAKGLAHSHRWFSSHLLDAGNEAYTMRSPSRTS